MPSSQHPGIPHRRNSHYSSDNIPMSVSDKPPRPRKKPKSRYHRRMERVVMRQAVKTSKRLIMVECQSEYMSSNNKFLGIDAEVT